MRRAATAVLAAVSVAGCSGGGAASAPPAGASAGSGVVATRWWSNGAVQAGSTIDPAAPRAQVANLHASRLDYCGMLRQTVQAGTTILAGVTATDPALLASTEAFVGEIQKVAPAAVAGPWRRLGRAVLALVNSDGDVTKVRALDGAGLRTAAAAISADATSNCGLDLAGVRPTK